MSINGQHLDWENIEIVTPGGLMALAKSISYSHEKGLDAAYDKDGKKSGRIRKGYQASGEMELTRTEGDRLIAALGAGYLGNAEFSVAVAGAGGGSDVAFADVLNGCVITKVEEGGSQEGEAITKISLDIKELLINGVSPFA